VTAGRACPQRAARHPRLPNGALNYYIPNVRFFAQHFLDTSCKSLVAKELRAVANVPKNWLFGSGYAGLRTDAPYLIQSVRMVEVMRDA